MSETISSKQSAVSSGESEGAAATAVPGRLAALSLVALGVIYGDIGTSPLYAVRECFWGPHAIEPSYANVLGVLSLIFWSLILVISVKYLAYVLRADHHGEGGILALLALSAPKRGPASEGRRTRYFVLIGLVGAGLLYGDGMITPAISVLSAVEGLEVVAPSLEAFVIPVAVGILVALFLLQHRGTHRVGVVFGPVTLLWFAVIAAIGASQIVRSPRVLTAANPAWAVQFFLHNDLTGFVVLGAVFLVVTGGEALYADLGHFGARPIRLTWFAVVLPALLLNYFGQGALLLRDAAAARNPFYHAAPDWGVVPLIVLSTAATVIASQAVISATFSLSRQAVMMGFLPRMRIEHTSSQKIGQIYVPAVNWALLLATILLVVGFGSSSALAAAYGIAVTMTMLITTALAYRVARWRWGWPTLAAASVTLVFLLIDLTYFGANLVKIASGGWVPLAVAGAVLVLMTTWRRGRGLVAGHLRAKTPGLPQFMAELRRRAKGDGLSRVHGTAVYMSSTPDVAPLALIFNLEHHHVLHERIVILTVSTDDAPYVAEAEKAWLEPLGVGIWRLAGVYGFMEVPDVPSLLQKASSLNPPFTFSMAETTFFLGQETVLSTDRPGMARWRERLFGFMVRNAANATSFFNLPSDRVVEIRARVEI